MSPLHVPLHARRFGAVSLLSVAIAACGDHSSLGIDPGQLLGDTTLFGPGTTGSLTTRERVQALDALQTVVSGLQGGASYDADTKALVSKMQSLPQFAAAGSSPDGTVWGMFKDGILVFVASSGPPDSAASNVAPGFSLQPEAKRPSVGGRFSPPTLERTSISPFNALGASTARADAGGTVPSSPTFRLFDGVGPAFSGDTRSTIEAMLIENGYTGGSETAALKTLRTVSNVGVFYIRTIGGAASTQAANTILDTYGLWTTDEATDSTAEAKDPALVDDLKHQRVAYMYYRVGNWQRAADPFPPPFPLPVKNRHYAITSEFISHYMSFSDNSLIYIDASFSSAQPALAMAFKNASLFVGWNGKVGFEAAGRTSAYVFDRLLGANKFVPETPQQRPFPYYALMQDPKFGHGKSFGYSLWGTSSGTEQADLQMAPLAGQFGMLAPTIFNVTVEEQQDQLDIAGDFGPNPGSNGKVTIEDGSGEVALAIKQWNPDLITTQLNRTGPGSAGGVVVSVRGHHSNVRQLLEWRGTFTWTLKEAGSLTQTWSLDLRARVDPQESRVLPGSVPFGGPRGYISLTDGFQATYDANGEATVKNLCTVVTQWNGHGTVSSKFPPTSQTSYASEGEIDVGARTWKLGFNAKAARALSTLTTTTCGSTTTTSPGTEDMFATPWDQGDGGGITLNLDAVLGLSASQKSLTEASGIDPTAKRTYTIRWPSISTRPIFIPSLPR